VRSRAALAHVVIGCLRRLGLHAAALLAEGGVMLASVARVILICASVQLSCVYDCLVHVCVGLVSSSGLSIGERKPH
jgi:hypothetical protein